MNNSTSPTHQKNIRQFHVQSSRFVGYVNNKYWYVPIKTVIIWFYTKRTLCLRFEFAMVDAHHFEMPNSELQ